MKKTPINVSVFQKREGARFGRSSRRLTCQLGDEEGETDTDGCNESRLALLGSQHEDGKDQFCCEKHLDEQALSDRCAFGQGCLHRQCTREHAGHQCSGHHGPKYLRWEEEEATDRW